MKIPQLFGMIPRNIPIHFTPQYKVDLFKIKKADVKTPAFSAEREGGEPSLPYNLKSILYFSKFSIGNELGTKISASFVHL